MGVKAINIGDRQILRERGNNVIDAPVNHRKIIKCIEKIKRRKISKCKIYGDKFYKKNYKNFKKCRLDIKQKFYVR